MILILESDYFILGQLLIQVANNSQLEVLKFSLPKVKIFQNKK